jgi:hypothetical protein
MTSKLRGISQPRLTRWRPRRPPIKLVLRSGQQIQVQDYAVVNGMFWDFTNQPVRRIPIAGIDIPASQKATEESGAEFPQLGQPN